MASIRPGLALPTWLSLALAVTEKITHVPPLRAGAAFFSFLRNNLSPSLDPSDSRALPPLLPTLRSSINTPFSTTPAIQDEDSRDTVHHPTPTTHILRSPSEKLEALTLISASIAQQRWTLEKSLLLDPRILLAYFLALVILIRLLYHDVSDLFFTATNLISLTITALAALRLVTSKYTRLARDLDASFLSNPNRFNEEDMLLGTYLSTHIIGVLVLRLERLPSSPKSKKTRSGNGKSGVGGKGIIRAWTTEEEHRGSGVGRGLLVEAVRRTRERVGKEAEIGFAVEHANGERVGWGWMNGAVGKGERRAAGCLDGLLGRGGRRHVRGFSM